MPRRRASLAMRAPIAPSPITPKVLPEISVPANWDLPASICLGTSAPERVLAQLVAAK